MIGESSTECRSYEVFSHVDKLLKVTFNMLCRIALSEESEDEKLPQYKELVYNHNMIDVAKLYDIAAVYGPVNPEVVKKLITNIFENDMRYLSEFGQSADMMTALLKKSFSASLRVTEMVNGDPLLERDREDQDEIIKRLLLDMSEILTNIELTTRYFPDLVLESVRNTALPLFMGNVYALMIGPVKNLWLKDSIIKDELNILRQSLKKTAIESCITILDVALVKCIGVFTKNAALV